MRLDARVITKSQNRIRIETEIGQDATRRAHNAKRARAYGAKICGPVAVGIYRKVVTSGPCVYCGSFATRVDHILPLSRGGNEVESNLVPACALCNESKGAKLLTEWIASRVSYGVTINSKVATEYARLTEK